MGSIRAVLARGGFLWTKDRYVRIFLRVKGVRASLRY
jgi:hypothetical protein